MSHYHLNQVCFLVRFFIFRTTCYSVSFNASLYSWIWCRSSVRIFTKKNDPVTKPFSLVTILLSLSKQLLHCFVQSVLHLLQYIHRSFHWICLKRFYINIENFRRLTIRRLNYFGSYIWI